jgi:Zn-dependent protease with chaperone function
MTVAAFFDGESARNYVAEVRLEAHGLAIEVADSPPRLWSLAGLHAVDPPAPGQPFRLTHADHIGQRLIIRDADFIGQVVAKAAHLQGGYFGKSYFKQVAGWSLAGLAVLAVLGYGVLSVLPGSLATYLPEKLKTETSRQIIASLTATARECETAGGRAALDVLAQKLADPMQKTPIRIHVYDMDLLNAFAVPGSEIILTREVIRKAESPDEVAGVLAHEMGHVAHLDPEQQLVRVLGLQAVMSIFSGSYTGDVVSSAAGLVAIFSYSREAERKADEFARSQLKSASIDPLGLKHFFEKVIKIEGARSSEEASPFSKIGGLLASHPVTEDRIKLIEPVPALTPQQWKDLQGMCG